MTVQSTADELALSVIVPAYNEQDRLGRTLSEIVGYLRERGDPFEILVVDDGSADDTTRVVDAREETEIRLIRLDRNRGKGAALRAGVLAARGQRVLLTDADLSTPIAELEKLEPLLERVPVVIGSRVGADASIELAQPFYRQWMGKMFNRILHLLGLCTDFVDTQCGFKLLEGKAARLLFSQGRIERFAYDMELLELALLNGMEVREVGVLWINSPASKVRLIADSTLMLRDALGLSWRLRRLRRERKRWAA